LDSSDATLLDQLNSASSRMARLVLDGPQNGAIEQHQTRLAALKEERDRLEGEISERSAEFRAASQHVTIDQIRATLPENSALLEFVAYHDFRPTESEKYRQGELRYAVYIVRRTGEPRWKDLGEAKSLDKLIAGCRQALRDPNSKDVQ